MPRGHVFSKKEIRIAAFSSIGEQTGHQGSASKATVGTWPWNACNMEMASQVELRSMTQFCTENRSVKDGDIGVKLSTPENAEPETPAKRPTRQWAAWTRQEEESFFAALRQVGKNFEKITHRVQSKNKDQVRHYYYRLIRRMNKLLGPGLCLDAKNSKDTNAAMLRWWSLLEKYSCKASKLHLKPRRFKIFIEALENQLLKDRKKNIKRRMFPGEIGSPTASNTLMNQGRGSGQDMRSVKLVLIDSQNIPKIAKGSLKRTGNMGVIRGSNKGESSMMKPPRQRRKSIISPAAYKKWEKAAIAGVSLVADAAEHLERAATDKEVKDDTTMADKKHLDSVENIPPPHPAALQSHFLESNVNCNAKLKLQLFPIDDSTRKALEMDKHNPHLELTLSTRKKISSVLEHLTRKWGHSTVAAGELLLFPYNVHRENLVGHRRWTQDSSASALDVYTSVGSPSVFRLRYGWFLDSELISVDHQFCSYIPAGRRVDNENLKEKGTNSQSIQELSNNDKVEKHVGPQKEQLALTTQNEVPNDISKQTAARLRSNFDETFNAAACVPRHGNGTSGSSGMRQLEDVDGMRLSNGVPLSAGDWADSLTNISVGDLLSEAIRDENPDCFEQAVDQTDHHSLQRIPFSCDSFDAAIAGHILKFQNKTGFASAASDHTFSIWDGEETCDAFFFQKNQMARQDISTSSTASLAVTENKVRTNIMSTNSFDNLNAVEVPVNFPLDEDPMDDTPSDPQIDNSTKDLHSLTDIYWPESLGPLDLDISSCKYSAEDLILSDSLSGLNRLIASSLDAFQSCSFLGLDKKEPASSSVKAHESATFSDFKIGSEA